MRQLGAGHIEQKPAMPPLGELPRVDVLLPGLVGDDQRDLGMRAQNLYRLIGARIVIGDDRVDLVAEIVERVGQDQRLVADARHGDEKMLLAEQGSIAGDESARYRESANRCCA